MDGAGYFASDAVPSLIDGCHILRAGPSAGQPSRARKLPARVPLSRKPKCSPFFSGFCNRQFGPRPWPQRRFPAIVALEERDHVLAGRVEDLSKCLDGGFHRTASAVRRASGTRSSPLSSFGSRASRSSVRVTD